MFESLGSNVIVLLRPVRKKPLLGCKDDTFFELYAEIYVALSFATDA